MNVWIRAGWCGKTAEVTDADGAIIKSFSGITEEGDASDRAIKWVDDDDDYSLFAMESF